MKCLQGKACTLSQKDDVEDFQRLSTAMEVMNFTVSVTMVTEKGVSIANLGSSQCGDIFVIMPHGI